MSTTIEISEELMAEVDLEAKRRSTAAAELVPLLIRVGLEVTSTESRFLGRGVGAKTNEASPVSNESKPSWFGRYADRLSDLPHDMDSIRESIARGSAKERGH